MQAIAVVYRAELQIVSTATLYLSTEPVASTAALHDEFRRMKVNLRGKEFYMSLTVC